MTSRFSIYIIDDLFEFFGCVFIDFLSSILWENNLDFVYKWFVGLFVMRSNLNFNHKTAVVVSLINFLIRVFHLTSAIEFEQEPLILHFLSSAVLIRTACILVFQIENFVLRCKINFVDVNVITQSLIPICYNRSDLKIKATKEKSKCKSTKHNDV